MIVEQFLPAFHYGDAIGNSTFTFHRYLEVLGVESRIVALTIDPGMEDKALFFKDYRVHPQSLKILHFAIPSPLSRFFQEAPGKKVIVYHNITPPHFFVHFSRELVRLTEAGRQELQRLKGVFDLCLADSEYNAGEMRQLGFANVQAFPIMIDLSQYAGDHAQAFYDMYRDERQNMLWVGRITPNKKVEDLIKVLFFYKKFLNPSIRLIVVGTPRTLPRYFLACRDLASRFHLTSEDIVFTGHLPFDEFLAAYRLADLFISMSEHEGFCLPLIESCFFEVPVLAYAAGSVPEILGGAGILIREKKFDFIAAAAEEIMNRPEVKFDLKERARQRIVRYREESCPERLFRILQAL